MPTSGPESTPAGLPSPVDGTRRRLLLASAAAGALPLIHGCGPKPGGKLRVGFQKNALLLYLKSSGDLQSALEKQNVVVEWHEMKSGIEALEAINVNAIDLALNGLPTIYGAEREFDFKILGGFKVTRNEEGILVNAESPISRLGDLAGKRIAYSKSSSTEHLVRYLLKREGVDFSEVMPRFLSAADGGYALESGAVDAWAVWNPIFTMGMHNPRYRVLATRDAGRDLFNVYLVRSGYAQENPDVVERVKQALAKGWTDMRQQASVTAGLLQEATGVPGSVWEEILAKDADQQWQEAKVVADSLQKTSDEFYEFNMTSRKVDLHSRAYSS